MEQPGRRILLAIRPGMLEGALATLLSASFHGDIVQVGRNGLNAPGGTYDAAVVSDQLPEGVRVEVVITLPDTRGSGGIGTVRRGEDVHPVNIDGPERVVELLDQYVLGRP